MNNIDLRITPIMTYSHNLIIVIKFIKDGEYLNNSIVYNNLFNEFKINGLYDISNIKNMPEEDYFMQSINWIYDIPLDAAINTINLVLENNIKESTLVTILY